MQANRRGVTPLLALTVVFALPAVLAWCCYFGFKNHDFGNTGHGHLLHPIHDLAELQLSPATSLSQNNQGAHRWTLIYAVPACDDACFQQLQRLVWVRQMLGREMQRTQLWLVTPMQQLSTSLRRRLQQIQPQAVTLVDWPLSSQSLLPQLSQAFPMLLMDPNHNLMMGFTAGIEPMALRQDWLHLLKLSKIG